MCLVSEFSLCLCLVSATARLWEAHSPHEPNGSVDTLSSAELQYIDDDDDDDDDDDVTVAQYIGLLNYTLVLFRRVWKAASWTHL